MSLTDTTAAPVTRVIAGATVQFPKLTLDEIGMLLSEWAEQDRVALRALLDETQADAETRRKELRQHAEQSRLIQYFFRCLFDFDRAKQVLTVSAAKASGNGKAGALTLDPDELLPLVADITGMEYARKPADAGEEHAADPKGASAPPAPAATGS